jgi:hypothetical protein
VASFMTRSSWLVASLVGLLLSACSVTEDAIATSESEQTATSTWGTSCSTTATDITGAIGSNGTFHGTTAGTSVGLSTCGDRTGKAKVLRYDLPNAGNYRVDVTSALPASDPSAASAAVVVRSDCQHLVNEIACNDVAATKSTFVGYHLTTSIFIRVEGDWYAQGFDLTITKLPFECRSDSECTDWPNGKCNQLNGNCISHLQCRNKKGNCDGNWDNGCETDLETSPTHCGACRATCDTSGGNASAATCNAGVCQLTCNPDFANCDGNTKNGCEANLQNEGLTCGACGTSCGGGVCAGGSCASHGEELGTVPGKNTTGNYSSNFGVRKLALSANRVVVKDDSYIGKVWSVPRAGGTPVFVGEGVDFGATPEKDEVFTIDIRKVSRVSEAGGTKTTFTLGQFEEARLGGADENGAVLLEHAVASSPYTPASVRTMGWTATASTPLWWDDGSFGRFSRAAITKDRIVVRAVGWSGYSYNDYSRSFGVIDRATGAKTDLGTLPSSRDVPFTADDQGVYWGGEGAWFQAYGSATATKLWSGAWVSSIVTDATQVYFVGGETCGLGSKPGRIYAMPKGGGTPHEIGFDQVGPKVGSFSGTCYSTPGDYLAVDGTWLYWASEDRIRRIAK